MVPHCPVPCGQHPSEGEEEAEQGHQEVQLYPVLTQVGKCSHSNASGTLERRSFTDESGFSMYTSDDRQRVWRHVGGGFAGVNFVDQVAQGGSGVTVCAGICYRQQTI